MWKRPSIATTGRPAELAADQPAAMADRRAAREMRNVVVFERGFFLDLLHEAAQGPVPRMMPACGVPLQLFG